MVPTTNRTYPWLYVTYIFCKGFTKSKYRPDRKLRYNLSIFMSYIIKIKYIKTVYIMYILNNKNPYWKYVQLLLSLKSAVFNNNIEIYYIYMSMISVS